MTRLEDPFVSSVVALVAFAAAGFVALAWTWRGVAAQVVVGYQVPFLVSGGIAGVALIGFILGVLVIQHRRWVEAQRRAELEPLVTAAANLLAAVRVDVENGD